MMKSLSESLKARGPFLRGERVEPRAGGQQRVELAIDGEIEMRDGLLGERQPLGDEATHRVVRHDLVGPRLVEREHLAVGEPARLLRLAPRDQLLRARLRRLLALDGLGRSDVEIGSIRSATLGVAWAARSTSRLTMRPCGPEPLSVASSSPSSRASRRASGEAKMRVA